MLARHLPFAGFLAVGLLIDAPLYAQVTPAKLNVNDTTAIRSTLEKFRKALSETDGEGVVKVLDAKTIQWYDAAVKESVALKKAELVKLPLLHRLMVLRLRHDFKRPDLEKKTGKETIVYAVEKGWISRGFVDMIVVQNFSLDRDGLAYVTLRQNPKIPAFYFAKEEGQWHLALTRTTALADKGFEQLAKKSGLTEQEFLFKLLEDATKNKPDPKIMEGPLD